MQINRIAQDKLNKLSEQELNELAKSYVGKTAIILDDGYDGHVFTKTMIIKEFAPIKEYFPDGFTVGFVEQKQYVDARVGDKTILFSGDLLDSTLTFQIQQLAVEGDELNVRQSDGSYSNLTIKELDETHILLTDEFGVIPDRLMNFPIARKSMITPMVMNIGALTDKPLVFPADSNKSRFEINDLFVVKETNELFKIQGFDGVVAWLQEKEDERRMDKYTLGMKVDNGEYIYLKDLKVEDLFINPIEETEIYVYNVNSDKIKIKYFDTTNNQVFKDDTLSQNALKNLLIKNYYFKSRDGLNVDTQIDTNVPEPMDVDTTLNMEGDFISEFINKNATNLLDLEKNNKPIFDVVEMTLNLLNQKFGKGDIADKVQDVVQITDDVVTQDTNLIGLKEIKVISNEGKEDLKNKVFTTWTDFTNALKPLYDDTIGGYNKVRFRATFEDGSSFGDRVDVGANDYNPFNQKVGDYVDRPFDFEDKLGDDLDAYQWDDEVAEDLVDVPVSDGGFSAEDIQEEIDNLEISLMYEEDEDTIKFINDKIEQLKFSLTLI